MAASAAGQYTRRLAWQGARQVGTKIPGIGGRNGQYLILRLELSRFVEGDLDAIAGYIAKDNPAHAVSFIREIRAQIGAIGKNPLLYRLRPEIGADARMAFAGQYAILFRVMDKVVRIERVVYGGRDLLAVFKNS
ncbi:MAG TPA: type II toxin-antitoxin system RelE/ParE family toxin [Acidobacteriaceae bacterium]|nr:type II toxin-antitoxin system RelE/ParE family toxin [Acidobacteriaceae bacterium]